MVQPGAFDEPDPEKRLSMFSVKVKVMGRTNVLKSLMMVGGQVKAEVIKQQKDCVQASFNGAQEEMHANLRARIAAQLVSK